MTKPMKPEEMKRKLPAEEYKRGYWEPDIDLLAMLESIEIDEPQFAKTGRPRYWTEERALQVGKELLEWAKHPEALNTTRFMVPKGLDKTHANKLAEVYPRFRKLYSKAKEMIGSNREIAAGKKFDPGMAKKYAGVYDSDYSNWELQLRDIDASAREKSLTVNVRGVMPEQEPKEPEKPSDEA